MTILIAESSSTEDDLLKKQKPKHPPNKKKADAPHSSNFWFLVCLPAPRALRVLFNLVRLHLTSVSETGITRFSGFHTPPSLLNCAFITYLSFRISFSSSLNVPY